MKYKTKKTLKTLALSVLGIGALVGVASGINTLAEKQDTELKTIIPIFEVGGLNDANGKFEESKKTIYTKDAFECYGLEVSLDFDNNIKYQLFYYDENNEFIGSSDIMTSTFDSDDTLMPYETKYCRIEVTPILETDVKEKDQEIKWYEVAKYSTQLDIKVSKDQDNVDGVKVYVNVFEIDEAHIGQFRTLNGGSGNYGTAENMGVAKPINVKKAKQVKFVFGEEGSQNSLYTFEKTDATGISSAQIGEGLNELIIDVPEGAELLYVGYVLGYEFNVYILE